MGATASRSSPSLPAKCGVFETKQSETCLFTVPHYSKWARMRAGTSLNFNPLLIDDMSRHFGLKVYPAGFDEESADFIAFFIHSAGGPSFMYMREGTCRVSFEILHETGQRTVFDNHTALSRQTVAHRGSSRGYVRFVKRREMEASSCVRRGDDSFLVRCTVSKHVEVNKRWAKVFAAVKALYPLKPEAKTIMKPEAKTITGSHVFTIDCFSKVKAALRSGECAHSAQFRFGGSRWYLKVYPNGRCDASRNCMSVFLGRGRSDEKATTAEFGFEIVGLTEVGKVEFAKHTFDGADPEHGFLKLVTSSNLSSGKQMVCDNRLVVRCHLRVINVTTPCSLPAAAAVPLTVASVPASGRLEYHPKDPGTTVRETENKETSESARLLSELIDQQWRDALVVD